MSELDQPTEPENIVTPPAPEMLSRAELLLCALVFEGGQILVAWFCAWLFGLPLWEQLTWEISSLWRGLALAAPLLVLFLVFNRWPVGPLRSIRKFMDQVLLPFFESLTWFDLTVISLLAGFGEELLFRGFLQPWLAYWLGLPLGLALGSILFGLCHPMTPAYAVLAAVVGVYLGMAVLVTGNLLDVIIAHAVYDLLALVWLLKLEKQAPSPDEAISPPSDSLPT